MLHVSHHSHPLSLLFQDIFDVFTVYDFSPGMERHSCAYFDFFCPKQRVLFHFLSKPDT